MKVAVIGQGYVGLTISSFASSVHDVIGFDTNQNVVNSLNAGISHIEGVKDQLLVERISTRKFRATSNPKDLADCDIVVIAVPTPLSVDRKPDMCFIEAACETIGKNLAKEALIINESTSFPGTLRDFIKPLIETYSEVPLKHLYAISPERVDPGREDFDQKNTSRLYAGLTSQASEMTRQFYSSFCDNLIKVSSPEVAEAAKLFENTFRQVNIALVNEFAQITNALGISVHETLNAANTKPYGFMMFTPSAGVGGHCIPVDPTYLATKAEELGVSATFIRHSNEVNSNMAKYVVQLVSTENGGSLAGKHILVVGVAYKSNVADVRETAAERVIEECRARGALVTWHDELVREWNGEVSVGLQGAEITIVVTKHAYMNDESIRASAPYVFDTTGTIDGARQF